MKRFIKSLTLKRLVLWITVILAILAALILKLISNSQIKSLKDQHAGERWSNVSKDTQISFFFDQDYGYTYYDVRSFEATVNKKLLEASIVSQSENENSRQWIYAYSYKGKLDLEGKAGKASPVVYAVGGDFFQFHPLEMVTGSYFSDSDVMKDYIIIDRDLAWQLFGSDDIVGQQVWAGDRPFMISGVFDREEGKLNDAAGNNKPTAYVSYEGFNSVMNVGMESGEGTECFINCYEIIIPNPVKGYGMNFINDNFKGVEGKYQVVENSTRFDFLNLLKVIGNFGKRSMGQYSIIFPYWENIARGYEDVLALLLLIRLALITYAVVVLIVFLVIFLKNVPWKDIKKNISNRYDEFRCSDHKKIKDLLGRINRKLEEDL